MPVLKINDINVMASSQSNSPNHLVANINNSGFGKDHVSGDLSSSTNIQTNNTMDESDEYDEDDCEDTCDEDETVDIEALEREVLKVFRNHESDNEYDLYR